MGRYFLWNLGFYSILQKTVLSKEVKENKLIGVRKVFDFFNLKKEISAVSRTLNVQYFNADDTGGLSRLKFTFPVCI